VDHIDASADARVYAFAMRGGADEAQEDRRE
jgi:hypothetical protein